MTAPSTRSELAAAIRRINALYRSVPEGKRPEVRWDAADDALEAALTADSRRVALAAIRAWETHWRSIIREVAR